MPIRTIVEGDIVATISCRRVGRIAAAGTEPAAPPTGRGQRAEANRCSAGRLAVESRPARG